MSFSMYVWVVDSNCSTKWFV